MDLVQWICEGTLGFYGLCDLLFGVGRAAQEFELRVGAIDQRLETLSDAAKASVEAAGTSAALCTNTALPTAIRRRWTSSFSRSRFRVAFAWRICSSRADSEVVRFRLVYLSVLSSNLKSVSTR